MSERKILAEAFRCWQATKIRNHTANGTTLAPKHVSASTWWKGLCSSEPLSAVASAVLQIPPTAGACESVRSRFCNSKMQGSLSEDRAQKLVTVQTNLNLLEPSDCEYASLESEDEKKASFKSETQ